MRLSPHSAQASQRPSEARPGCSYSESRCQLQLQLFSFQPPVAVSLPAVALELPALLEVRRFVGRIIHSRGGLDLDMLANPQVTVEEVPGTSAGGFPALPGPLLGRVGQAPEVREASRYLRLVSRGLLPTGFAVYRRANGTAPTGTTDKANREARERRGGAG